MNPRKGISIDFEIQNQKERHKARSPNLGSCMGLVKSNMNDTHMHTHSIHTLTVKGQLNSYSPSLLFIEYDHHDNYYNEGNGQQHKDDSSNIPPSGCHGARLVTGSCRRYWC